MLSIIDWLEFELLLMEWSPVLALFMADRCDYRYRFVILNQLYCHCSGESALCYAVCGRFPSDEKKTKETDACWARARRVLFNFARSST